MKPIARTTACKDGTTLSIQASQFHYSTPRRDEGPYTAMEVGYISDPKDERITPPDAWREYSDGEFPSDVYGYVPVELIDQFIEAHGGRVEQEENR